MAHFVFQCFVTSLLTRNIIANSENLTYAANYSLARKPNQTTLWSHKNDYAAIGHILLILGILADVLVLTIPITLYFCTTRHIRQGRNAPFQNVTSQSLILEISSAENNSYKKPDEEHIARIHISKKPQPIKKCNSVNTLYNSKEAQISAGSSLNYPTHSSEMSLLTQIKRHCKISYPSSTHGKNECAEENLFTNQSSRTEDEYVKPFEFVSSFNTSPVNSSSDSKKSSHSTASQNDSDEESKNSTADEFSDNLKHYWPKYVTALQDPTILQKKNEKLLKYYESNQFVEHKEERDECGISKKGDSKTTIDRCIKTRNKNSSRYLRIDPPVNFDDPWISDEIRQKLNIPTFVPESQQTLESKELFPKMSLYTMGTKSVGCRQPHSTYALHDIQYKKLLPPVNLSKESISPNILLPPPLPAEERRKRSNYPQRLSKMVHHYGKEINEIALYIKDVSKGITNQIHKPVMDAYEQADYKIDCNKNQNDGKYQSKEGNEVKKNSKNERKKTSTTVEIIVPKGLDISKPASAAITLTHDSFDRKMHSDSLQITSSDASHLGKDRTCVSDILSVSRQQPSSMMEVKTNNSFGVENDTGRKTVEKSEMNQPRRSPTKKRIHQDKIRQQRLLAIQKKKDYFKQKRDDQQLAFRRQRQMQKKRYQTEENFITQSETPSKLKRRENNESKTSESLTSGTFVDRESPYRMRFMDKAFMKSVRLGKEKVFKTSDTMSSGVVNSFSSKVCAPIFVELEDQTRSQFPEYKYYDAKEKVSTTKRNTFYTMEYERLKRELN